MISEVEHDAWLDPLGRDVQCRHTVEIPVLGIRTRFESNAPIVVDIASEGLGRWSSVPTDTANDETQVVVVRIVLDPSLEKTLGNETHRRLAYRMPDATRLLVGGPGVIGSADTTHLRSTAFVSPSLVGDREHFRYAVLEALANFHLSTLDRQPLHAACVVWKGRAVLLVGPAGVGKSTLTYAAMREGCRVLAEDIVWLQLRGAFAIWGLVTRIQLPSGSARFFPELEGLDPTVVSSGEEKLVVPVAPARSVEEGRVGMAAVCLVERSDDGRIRLERAAPPDLAAALGTFETGFDVFRSTITPAIDRLSRTAGWRLLLTDDPRDAVAELHWLLDQLTGSEG